MGYLSGPEINTVVRAHADKLRACYELTRGQGRSRKGKVILFWLVNVAGKVSTAEVCATTLQDADLESCLVNEVKSWRFPKPNGGRVAIYYPFIFGVGG